MRRELDRHKEEKELIEQLRTVCVFGVAGILAY